MPDQPPSGAEMNKALFLHLVSMLSMSALQELGKLKNALTGKVEVRLEAAQATIDLLAMLEAKTRGNRDAEEDKALKDSLTMLQMNYVESAEAATARRSEPQRSEVTPSAQSAKGPLAPTSRGGVGTQPEDKKTEDHKPETKDPKYHKTYS